MSNNDNTENNVLPTINGVSIMSYTDEELDSYAVNELGVVRTISPNINVGDKNVTYRLTNTWKAKWLVLGNSLVLKLITDNKDKKFLLNKGIISYFMKLGFSKFISVALLKARIKYKIELAPILQKIMNNNSYHQAYKSHPAYRDNYDRNEAKSWLERWSVVFDGERPFIPFNQDCELVRMIKVVEEATEAFKNLPPKEQPSKINKPNRSFKSKPANKIIRRRNIEPEKTWKLEDHVLNQI